MDTLLLQYHPNYKGWIKMNKKLLGFVFTMVDADTKEDRKKVARDLYKNMVLSLDEFNLTYKVHTGFLARNN